MIRIQFMQRVGMTTDKVVFVDIPYTLVSYIRSMTNGTERTIHTYELGVPHESHQIDLPSPSSRVVIYMEDDEFKIKVNDDENPFVDTWLTEKLKATEVKDYNYFNAWTK